MVAKLLKRMISQPFGRKNAQWFFECLRRASLIGLNIGRGGRVEDSGEEFVLKYVRDRFSPKPVRIFDVGANVGHWAAQALKHFDESNVELFCFEPSQAAFEQLTERFQQSRTVHLAQFGLGHQCMEMSLFSDSPASGIASLYRRRLSHFGIDFDQKNDEMVKIQTLDAFCKERQIARVDFLKLDVEGHELRVLEGATNLLESNAICFIQFEFGGCNIDSRTYFQDFFYLLNEKYRLFRILKNGLYPISQYREVDECFVTTNYLAELRT